MCEPIPYSISTWSKWAESVQRDDEIPGNRLAELISDLISLRAWIKSHPEVAPNRKASDLLHMDRKLVDWTDDLPAYWEYRSISIPQIAVNLEETGFDQQDDVYADFYAASMWLSYRSARIQLHVALMPLIMADDSLSLGSKQSALQNSRQILKTMTKEVCYSYSFIMGDIETTSNPDTVRRVWDGSSFSPAPGGYMLIWPLYLVGMLDTATKAQRYWIAQRLERIAICSGASLAMARAKALLIAAEDEFRESEHWPYINEKADPATV